MSLASSQGDPFPVKPQPILFKPVNLPVFQAEKKDEALSVPESSTSHSDRFVILSHRSLSSDEEQLLKAHGKLLVLDSKLSKYDYVDLTFDFLFVTINDKNANWLGLNLASMSDDYKIALCNDRTAKFITQCACDNVIKKLPSFVLDLEELTQHLLKAYISKPKGLVEKLLKLGLNFLCSS